MLNILVAEDDPKLQHLFCSVLKKHHFNPLPAGDGEIALKIMEQAHIDLVITDIMMPNMDGYALTKLLREYDSALPVLMITAKDRFEDKKQGFLVGTDDYMVKPVDVNEMILRIHALIRRSKIVSEHKILWGSTTLIYDSLVVCYDGKEVQLPQKEFYILYKLMSYPGTTFTRQKLMEEIWGMDTDSEERTVDVHINRIRERLKDNPDIKIITVHCLGYKMIKPETQRND
ncbi:response regulator transcription factor [Lacrimispora sp. JR3]|uniref:response regulator transcription factor n=1 Tax=Lacrimispora sinapis TaxID=3111456 RepID=UPI00374901B3